MRPPPRARSDRARGRYLEVFRRMNTTIAECSRFDHGASRAGLQACYWTSAEDLTELVIWLSSVGSPVGGMGQLASMCNCCRNHLTGATERDCYFARFKSSKILPFIKRAISVAGSGFWHSDNGLSQKFESGNSSNRLRAAAPRQVSGSFT